MLALAAGNRDPRRWENPQDFVLNRPKIKEHIAFGRGKHVCAGAPLARVEVRIILEKFLEHSASIDLDASKHGPYGERKLDYEPSFIIRGLANLNLKLTPAPAFVPSVGRTAPKAQRPAAPAANATAKSYSTASTRINDLLADPATKALLDEYLPGISSDPRIAMAKAMTLRAVQAFAPAQFTHSVLDALDAEFAKLAQRG